MSKDKSIAWNVKQMRRGDIYVDAEQGVIFRDSEQTDKVHHVGPFGDVWKIDCPTWPAVRIYTQERGDCEDPREFKKMLRKK